MDPKEFLTIVAARCPAYREHLSDCALRVLRPDGDVSAVPGTVEALEDGAADELVRRHLLCLCRKNGCSID